MAGHDVSGEPRDERGRWTDGSGVEWTANGSGRFEAAKHPKIDLNNQTGHLKDMKAFGLVHDVREAATKMDFDPEKVTITDRKYDFEVDGQHMTAAGTAHSDDGRITIYADHATKEYMPQLMAHEVMHQMFNKYMADYKAEYERMQKDPDYHLESKLVPFDPNNPKHAAQIAAGGMKFTSPSDAVHTMPNGQIREHGFMNPNGTLNEPYASKYPLYQARTKMSNEHSTADLARTDGVSAYSKAYWTDWLNSKIGTDIATHETLAEIHRIKYKNSVLDAEHKAKLKEFKKLGVPWTAEDEAAYKRNRGTGYVHYTQGKEPVDGKKVYFASTKPRHLSPAWASLYKAVVDNWKRK